MISNLKSIYLKEKSSLKEAMSALNNSGLQIALVVDEHEHLIGTVTDGDIRRGILNSLTLDAPISEVMNQHPITATPFMSAESIRVIMREKSISAIPVVDAHKNILGLEILASHGHKKVAQTPVLIMAGGFGKRLGDLTKELPKPMLSLGSKPMLEHIIDSFVHQGFKRFFISTHYKSDEIKNYFKNGEEKRIEIEYLEEEFPLGTAGAIFLLKRKINENFLLLNGDLSIKFNFNHLVDFHNTYNPLVTMCVRESFYQIPYGVVEIDKLKVTSIVEKPQYAYHINAGIYCFSKEVFEYFHEEVYLDIPNLLHRIIYDNKNVSAFPLYEYWMDIGTFETLKKARKDCFSLD